MRPGGGSPDHDRGAAAPSRKPFPQEVFHRRQQVLCSCSDGGAFARGGHITSHARAFEREPIRDAGYGDAAFREAACKVSDRSIVAPAFAEGASVGKDEQWRRPTGGVGPRYPRGGHIQVVAQGVGRSTYCVDEVLRDGLGREREPRDTAYEEHCPGAERTEAAHEFAGSEARRLRGWKRSIWSRRKRRSRWV